MKAALQTTYTREKQAPERGVKFALVLGFRESVSETTLRHDLFSSDLDCQRTQAVQIRIATADSSSNDKEIPMAYEKQPQVGLTIEQEFQPEDWQAKVQGLQETVCLLLIKNQEMRMALSAEDRNIPLRSFL